MVRYFFYGTLMDAAVRRAVLRRDVPAVAVIAAELRGWRRVFRAGATFPVLVPAPSERVDGVAIDGLTDADAEALARFEGPDYRVRRVSLVLRPCGRMTALTFVAARPAVVGTRPWNYATWQQRHRQAFVNHTGTRGSAA
jgi:hypothetical protein